MPAASKAPDRRSKFFVQETRTRVLYIQVAHRTIQVSHVGNMADDRDDDLAVAANP